MKVHQGQWLRGSMGRQKHIEFRKRKLKMESMAGMPTNGKATEACATESEALERCECNFLTINQSCGNQSSMRKRWHALGIERW
jgi:hypothetical protein